MTLLAACALAASYSKVMTEHMAPGCALSFVLQSRLLLRFVCICAADVVSLQGS